MEKSKKTNCLKATVCIFRCGGEQREAKVGDARYIAEENCRVLRYNGKGKQILKDASVMREKQSPWGKSGGSQMLIAGVFEGCENSAFL